MARPRASREPAFKRDIPDLPPEFEKAVFENPFEDGESVGIHDRRIEGLERREFKGEAFRVEGSVLESVHLSAGRFGSISWKDSRLLNCDLANIRAHRISLLRVEFIDCRLTGFSAAGSEWRDVLIQNGDMRYVQLQGGTFHNCEFDRCNWNEAELQNSDLSGCAFHSCNLERADLHGAKLENTDFRTSDVEGIQLGPGDLRGAIVDPAQAMIFARLLGLRIR